MDLKMTQLDNGLRLITLTGRLDLVGMEQIETEFTAACSGEQLRILVDLSGVDFIASTGFRLLLNTAKAVATHGGKMGFLNPNVSLRDVLEVIGILAIIPVFTDVETAQKALS